MYESMYKLYNFFFKYLLLSWLKLSYHKKIVNQDSFEKKLNEKIIAV